MAGDTLRRCARRTPVRFCAEFRSLRHSRRIAGQRRAYAGMVQPQYYAGLSLRMREYENPAGFTSIDNSYQVRNFAEEESGWRVWALRDRMRFSVSLTSQPKSSGVGRLGFRGAWQCLSVRLIPAVALVVLLNAPGFGLHSAAEAQSKEPETRVEGNVCTASGAAVAEALVSLVNGAEEKVAETQTDGAGKFVITVALPGKHWLLEARKDGFRQVRVELAGLGEGEGRHCKVVMETSEQAKVGAETG